jgi:hypothetical protein
LSCLDPEPEPEPEPEPWIPNPNPKMDFSNPYPARHFLLCEVLLDSDSD